jgi:hypothetical protein
MTPFHSVQADTLKKEHETQLNEELGMLCKKVDGLKELVMRERTCWRYTGGMHACMHACMHGLTPLPFRSLQ